MANALKLVKKVKAVLEGPVALVMGACEVVIKMHEMGEDWESGNPKKVVGSGLEVLGNGLVVQIAAFEMVELVAGLIGLEAVEAGAAALTAAMGPVGWFAAALILTGTLLGILAARMTCNCLRNIVSWADNITRKVRRLVPLGWENWSGLS